MASVVSTRGILRLPAYDYRTPGSYFVTMCTVDRRTLFGSVAGPAMVLNEVGRCVEQSWRELPARFPQVHLDDAFVVMPNHVHGIIDLLDGPNRRPLGAVVGAFKGAVTRRVQTIHPGACVWQSGYYEHVVRDERALNQIRQYIIDNPATWAADRENLSRRGRDPLEVLLRECGERAVPRHGAS